MLSNSNRAIFHPSWANIINVALNPSQYLYNIRYYHVSLIYNQVQETFEDWYSRQWGLRLNLLSVSQTWREIGLRFLTTSIIYLYKKTLKWNLNQCKSMFINKSDTVWSEAEGLTQLWSSYNIPVSLHVVSNEIKN